MFRDYFRLSFAMAALCCSAQSSAAAWGACVEAIRTQPLPSAQIVCGEAFDAVTELAREHPQDYEQILTPLVEALFGPALMPKKSREVERVLLAALEDWGRELGREHTFVATLAFALSQVYEEQYRFKEAESLLLGVIETAERILGPTHPHVGVAKARLAMLYLSEGRFAEAEALSKQVLELRRRVFGENDATVADSLNGLGRVYQEQHRLWEAEPLFKRALAIREELFGPEHEFVADSLNNLATLFDDQFRLKEAEILNVRALGIRTKVLGPEHADTAQSLNNLASNLDQQFRFAEAEPLHKLAFVTYMKLYGPEHPDVGLSLNNLASNLDSQGRYAEAARLYEYSLMIRTNVFGTDSLEVANSLGNLGSNLSARGRYAEAGALHARALEIKRRRLGGDHPDVANSLGHLFSVYMQQGKTLQALNSIRENARIVHGRMRYGADIFLDAGAPLQTMRVERAVFHTLVSALHVAQEQRLIPDVLNESFEAGQLSVLSNTGSAVSQMSTRGVAANEKRAKLVRDFHNLQAKRKELDVQFLASLYSASARQDQESMAALREQIATTEKSLGTARTELITHFPEYGQLISPEPLSVQETQRLLKGGEAVLMFSVGPEDSFAWLITRTQARSNRIPHGWGKISEVVRKIRRPVFELEATGGTGALRAAEVEDSYWLYQQLIEPFAKQLSGVEHLLVVPDRALHSVPFAMLAQQMPSTPIKTARDHSKVRWLIERYAITVLPDLSALAALRSRADRSQATRNFLGFGDPAFEGDITAMTSLNRGALLGRKLADPSELRSQLAPLPETRPELISLARTLGADPAQSLFLADRATEANVKQLNLAEFKVLAFATHGLIAGEMRGLVEPALALTPPKEPSELDDGLLRASEINRLNLDAELVILSACNTAAPDGTPGGEGLSGLARSFFLAGARALLVTAWSVESESAQRLSTGTVKFMKQRPERGTAAALQRSMLELMKSPEYAHPYFWAPFMAVGDGS